MSHLRSIAPMEDTSERYGGSMNPTRRAKRGRSEGKKEEEEYSSQSPSPSPTPPPKRRGRKPGPLSRAAREAQRKINHSLIEKARRTKINDALATLRVLVPAGYKRGDEWESDEEVESLRAKKAKKSGEKEFKLEVLVRTVAYLQDLTTKVGELEDNRCRHCKSVKPALPSISTWLDDTHLPSPPTSSSFDSEQVVQPPMLTLPSPTARTLPRFCLSAEDETAASLLLQMSNSPKLAPPMTPSRLLGL